MSYCVVIPSAAASNLIPCVHAIRHCEPTLDPSSIIVVDDGAGAETEAVLLSVAWVQGIKPFVFARNVNLGIRAAGDADVILLNDDARLLTYSGFTVLSEQLQKRPDIGLCSLGIRGVVCNPNQLVDLGQFGVFREEPTQLAFIAVYVPRRVLDCVGLLDERFVGYGYEDFDYCRRVKAAGFKLATWTGGVVDHTGALPSTFRTRPDLAARLEHGRQLYREKWSD